MSKIHINRTLPVQPENGCAGSMFLCMIIYAMTFFFLYTKRIPMEIIATAIQMTYIAVKLSAAENIHPNRAALRLLPR